MAGKDSDTPSPNPPMTAPAHWPMMLNMVLSVSPPDEMNSLKPSIIESAPNAAIMAVTPPSASAMLASPSSTSVIGIAPTSPASPASAEPTTPTAAITISSFATVRRSDSSAIYGATHMSTAVSAPSPTMMIAMLARPFATVATGILPTMPANFASPEPISPSAVITASTLTSDLTSVSLAIYGATYISAAASIVRPPSIMARFAIPLSMTLIFVLPSLVNVPSSPPLLPPVPLPSTPPSRLPRPFSFLSSLNAPIRPITTGIIFLSLSAFFVNTLFSLPKKVSTFFMPGISPNASLMPSHSSRRINGISSTIADMMLGNALIRPFTSAVAALISGGSSESIMPGSSFSRIGASASIRSPMPSSALTIAGMTFFAKVFAESTRLSMQSSKESPPTTRLTSVLLHAAFIELNEPEMVLSASSAVVPVMPISS